MLDLKHNQICIQNDMRALISSFEMLYLLTLLITFVKPIFKHQLCTALPEPGLEVFCLFQNANQPHPIERIPVKHKQSIPSEKLTRTYFLKLIGFCSAGVSKGRHLLNSQTEKIVYQIHQNAILLPNRVVHQREKPAKLSHYRQVSASLRGKLPYPKYSLSEGQ